MSHTEREIYRPFDMKENRMGLMEKNFLILEVEQEQLSRKMEKERGNFKAYAHPSIVLPTVAFLKALWLPKIKYNSNPRHGYFKGIVKHMTGCHILQK